MACLCRFVATLLLATAALAQTTEPSDGPRAAALRLMQALQDGDAAAAKALLLAENPSEQALADALAEVSASASRLHAAATQAFGEAGAAALVGPREAQTAAGMRQVRDAPLQQTPTDATLAVPGRPLRLVQVEGQWRLPVRWFVAAQDPEEIRQRADDLKLQAGVLREVTGGIAAGELRSAEEAREALSAALMRALVARRERAPSTAPAP